MHAFGLCEETCTGKTPHREAQAYKEVQMTTFFPWGNSANHCAAPPNVTKICSEVKPCVKNTELSTAATLDAGWSLMVFLYVLKTVFLHTLNVLLHAVGLFFYGGLHTCNSFHWLHFHNPSHCVASHDSLNKEHCQNSYFSLLPAVTQSKVKLCAASI